jgi:hypothetical protein
MLMNREERDNRLWILASKLASGEMTDEEEKEYSSLKEEQSKEWDNVEFPIRESFTAKLLRVFRRNRNA